LAIEQKSREIDGVTYYVTQMDGIRALDIQLRLLKILGPALPKILGLKSFNISDIKNTLEKITPDMLIEVLQPLIDNFDDQLVKSFVLSLFSKGVFLDKPTIEGKMIKQPLDILNDFRSKPFTIWNVARFILEVNLAMGE
jgi:hypothetical protein